MTEQTDQLVTALIAAQGQMQNASLNKVNPHFKSAYADLAAIREATLPSLNKNGLALLQFTTVDEHGHLLLTTRLVHKSGQHIESVYPLPVDLVKPQAMGSAITYARRYSWAAMCGITAEEDDDANAATGAAKNGVLRKPSNGVTASKARQAGDYPAMEKEIRACTAPDEVRQWWADNTARIKALPDRPGPDGEESWQDFVKAECERKVKELEAANGG